VRKRFVCAVLAILTIGCNSDDSNPTNPSQVNIEFTITEITLGTGAQAAAGNLATVGYTGWLYNAAGPESKGTQFGSSNDPPPAGGTLQVRLGAGQFLPGFEQGILGMRVGGKRRVYMPANLAYGSRGSSDGRIPPNSALVFEIDLITLVQ
jgi:FKBP-type peptidyl-prolyl cis-trans isomerase FkpA